MNWSAAESVFLRNAAPERKGKMKEAEFIIRIMTMEDYPDVYKLWINTVGMGLRSLDDSREGIGKFLERNPRSCFVAENSTNSGAAEPDTESIAGVILSGHDGRRGYIYHAAVREQYRKKGIGRALIRAAEKALKEEGIHRIALVVYAGNETGNRFWEENGYCTRPDLVYRNHSINDENQ